MKLFPSISTLKTEAACSSDTSVTNCQASHCHNPDCENMKSNAVHRHISGKILNRLPEVWFQWLFCCHQTEN